MTDEPAASGPAAGSEPPDPGQRVVGDDRVDFLDAEAIQAGTDALGIGDGTAPTGTYVLVYSLGSAATIRAGALGSAKFPPGAYAYVGSAFGSNGLGRVDRHRRVASGDHEVTHWHIDYFGSNPEASLEGVVAVPNDAIECRLATEIAEVVGRRNSAIVPPLDGFGASDCSCATHLIGTGSGPGHESASDSLGIAAVDAASSVTIP